MIENGRHFHIAQNNKEYHVYQLYPGHKENNKSSAWKRIYIFVFLRMSCDVLVKTICWYGIPELCLFAHSMDRSNHVDYTLNVSNNLDENI